MATEWNAPIDAPATRTDLVVLDRYGSLGTTSWRMYWWNWSSHIWCFAVPSRRTERGAGDRVDGTPDLAGFDQAIYRADQVHPLDLWWRRGSRKQGTGWRNGPTAPT
jgi:hypothetical protein